MTTPSLSRVTWRKSSRSGSNEGACVEIATTWRKSTHSGSQAGTCVEVTLAIHTPAEMDLDHTDS